MQEKIYSKYAVQAESRLSATAHTMDIKPVMTIKAGGS